MSRYFVVWCLEEEIEEVLDAPLRYGQVVGQVVVGTHITGQYTGSAEIKLNAKEEQHGDQEA